MKFMVTSVASRLRVVKKLILGKNCRRSNGKTVDFEYYIGTIYQRRLTEKKPQKLNVWGQENNRFYSIPFLMSSFCVYF